MLLDTHVIVWAAVDTKRLSRAARRAIEAAAPGHLAISVFSLYELAALARKQAFSGSAVRDLMRLAELHHEVLPITGDICLETLALPAGFPGDPGDRIIAATAIVHRLPLISADGAIAASGAVETIW